MQQCRGVYIVAMFIKNIYVFKILIVQKLGIMGFDEFKSLTDDDLNDDEKKLC